jgi:hypothetical protein
MPDMIGQDRKHQRTPSNRYSSAEIHPRKITMITLMLNNHDLVKVSFST